MLNIETFENLCEQVLQEDNPITTYELIDDCLKHDYTEEEQKKISEVFNETLNKIDLYDINMLIANLAIYRQHELQERTWKFIDWVTHRLKLIVAKEMTLEQFFNQWDKHFEVIRANTKTKDTFDNLHVINIIYSVNQLR